MLTGEYAEGSRLEKDILLRKLRKLYRDCMKCYGDRGMQMLFNALPPARRYSLACARVYLGDFSNWSGWSFRDLFGIERNFSQHDIPMWRGENCNRLLIFGEQGLGDHILWASVIPEAMVRCKRVTYTCDKRLISLLERSLPGLKCIDWHWNEEALGPGPQMKDYDAYIAAADLLPLFRRRREDFPRRPFLRPGKPTPDLSAYAGRIGIGWGGRHGLLDPNTLGIPFDRLVSLQHDGAFPGIAAPPIDLHNDMESTLALVSTLVGVVCVPSSIHHLAGAAGAQVAVIWPQQVGEVNQVPWSHPPGPLAWYKDVTVYKTVKEFRDSSPLARAP